MERLESKIDKIHVDLIEINKQLAQIQIINGRHDEVFRDNSKRLASIEHEIHAMKGAIRLGKFVATFVLSCVIGMAGWVINYEIGKDTGLDTLKEQVQSNRHAIERADERFRDLKSELKYKDMP